MKAVPSKEYLPIDFDVDQASFREEHRYSREEVVAFEARLGDLKLLLSLVHLMPTSPVLWSSQFQQKVQDHRYHLLGDVARLPKKCRNAPIQLDHVLE